MPKTHTAFCGHVGIGETDHLAFVEAGLAYCDGIEAGCGKDRMRHVRARLHEFGDLARGETVDIVRLQALCEELADFNKYSACAFHELFFYASRLLEELTGRHVVEQNEF
jgi:hypothetical protein